MLEAEPETKRLGKKNVSLQELFYLSLIICLPQLILKNLLLQKGNFRTPDHHPTLGHLPLPRQTQGSVVSGSTHQVAKDLELQLQHPLFQRVYKTDFLYD